MFEKFIKWWKEFTKFTPPKDVKTLTDQECQDEYRKLWDKYAVFEQFMTSTEVARMRSLGDEIRHRGYEITGSVFGVTFKSNK